MLSLESMKRLRTPFKFYSKKQIQAEKQLRKKVLRLSKQEDLSSRDIGKIVGRSHTWVQNVLKGKLSP